MKSEEVDVELEDEGGRVVGGRGVRSRGIGECDCWEPIAGRKCYA